MSPTCFEPRGFILRETVVYAHTLLSARLLTQMHVKHTILHIELPP